jgi:hypothetical protein
VLYGGGPVPSLDHNQIFARWLQKRVVFVGNDGTRHNEIHAEGPDCQLVGVPQNHPTKGHFEIYSDDGELLIGRSPTVEVFSGQSFRWIHP